MSPASVVGAGVHKVLFSLSEKAILRGFPPAPNAKRKRSSVTTRPRQFVGAFATTAATLDGLSCHSTMFPVS